MKKFKFLILNNYYLMSADKMQKFIMNKHKDTSRQSNFNKI